VSSPNAASTREYRPIWWRPVYGAADFRSRSGQSTRGSFFLLVGAPGQGVGSRIGLRRRLRRAAHAVQVGEERMALLGNGSVRVWWVVCRVRAPAPVCKGARGSMAHDGRNVVRDLTWLTTAAQEMATELLGR
jgi:hypothetical protein